MINLKNKKSNILSFTPDAIKASTNHFCTSIYNNRTDNMYTSVVVIAP